MVLRGYMPLEQVDRNGPSKSSRAPTRPHGSSRRKASVCEIGISFPMCDGVKREKWAIG